MAAWARHRWTRWSRQLPWHRAYVRHVPVPYLTVVRSAASAILPESYFFNVYFIGRQEGRTVGRARRDRSGQVRVLACARLGMRTCSVRPQPKEQTCCRWAVGLCAAWARTVYTVTAVRTRRVTATASWLRATGQPIRADGIGRMMAKLHCMHYIIIIYISTTIKSHL
jgi:hypothetical protein